MLGYDAGERITGAAGAEWNNDPDGFGRPVLRGGRRRDDCACGKQKASGEQS
jgi:hypothetical protein